MGYISDFIQTIRRVHPLISDIRFIFLNRRRLNFVFDFPYKFNLFETILVIFI